MNANNEFPVDVTPEAIHADSTSTNETNYQGGNVFDSKNYLDTKIPDGKSEKSITIRLLPYPDTNSPFLHVHMHSIKVPTEISKSGFKSYVCIRKSEGFDKEQYGGKCPFCELNQSFYNDFVKETDPVKKDFFKKQSLANLPKEAVIMRCIERGKEDEGVKFWKVNVRQDKDDAYNKIKTLYEIRRDEWARNPGNVGKDPRESNILSIRDYGYDLTITFKQKDEVTKLGRTVTKTSVQITDSKWPSPLSTDVEQMKKWVYDEKKWFEVFVPKHYDYTALVIQGKVPFFDKSLRKWVAKEEFNENKESEVEKVEQQIAEAQRIAIGVQQAPETTEYKPTQYIPTQSVSAVINTPAATLGGDAEDDLPF